MNGVSPKLLNLSPTQFENLTFDLLQHTGMQNLVWRTPGADGGRDIEAIVISQDASGHSETQRWYVECKRYSDSVDWPIVWKKIAYADSNKADYMLIVTNSNPSPNCETEISKWNADRRSVKIRFWRGYDINKLLDLYPVVAMKYGLRTLAVHPTGFIDICIDLAKIVHSTYSSYIIGNKVQIHIEATGAISELITVRMRDLKLYGNSSLGLEWLGESFPGFILTWTSPHLKKLAFGHFVRHCATSLHLQQWR